jgi:DNA-directed RNA polymerase specialized sigma24 family protein
VAAEVVTGDSEPVGTLAPLEGIVDLTAAAATAAASGSLNFGLLAQRLTAFCRRRLITPTGWEPEDLANQSLLVLLQSSVRGGSEAAAWTFLKTTATQLALNAYRKNDHERDALALHGRRSSEECSSTFEAVAMVDVLSRLSETDRLLLALAAAGYSASEIAERCGLGVKATESALLRARRRAKAMWTGFDR